MADLFRRGKDDGSCHANSTSHEKRQGWRELPEQTTYSRRRSAGEAAHRVVETDSARQ